MQTQNGQTACLNGNTSVAASDAANNAMMPPLRTFDVADKKFVGYVRYHGVDGFIQSLKLVHNISLYHSQYPIDSEEKKALLDLKILWEGLEKLNGD